MDSTFTFNPTTTYASEIEIEDIQNCSIVAVDNMGMTSFYMISTDDGISLSVSAGPFFEELGDCGSSCIIMFSEYDASEYKTKKEINKFLAPKDKGKRKPVEIKTIDKEEARQIIERITTKQLLKIVM